MSSSSSLYERNLFYQQLNFKYVITLYLHSILWKIRSKGGGRTVILTLLFLVLYSIDFIIGTILLLVCIHNPAIKYQIGDALSIYTKTILEWSREYLVWLMGVPWGIKLNTPLSYFLGTRYLYILDLWKMFYSEFISLYLSVFINFLLVLLPFGVTLSITALHDFLKFLNLCLICFYIISNRIFTLQVSALKSFGRLFMGKKWNILRKRVDTCHYDITQLLVGTIIFTILLFLLPTVAMYMLAFLYLRLIQFAVQFALRVCAIFVNKLTLTSLLYLHSSLQPQPITKAKVRIRGLSPSAYAGANVSSPYKTVDGKWCKLECFSVKDEDVTILWNGKEYSVSEIREVMDSIPKRTLINEMQQATSPEVCEHADGDSVEAVVKRHSMVHWFWSLPKN